MPLLPDMVIIAEEVLATDCGRRTEVRNTVSLGRAPAMTSRGSTGRPRKSPEGGRYDLGYGKVARLNWPPSLERRGLTAQAIVTSRC